MPTSNQAGVCSQVLAYLHAVEAANTIEGEKVVAEMRRAPIEDKLFGIIVVRLDGRAIHAMHVFRVKVPAESPDRWDVYIGWPISPRLRRSGRSNTGRLPGSRPGACGQPVKRLD